MSEPLKFFCPNQCKDTVPTGEFMCFCPSTDDRRACDVYVCSECGEVFALTCFGAYCPVPDEVTS